MTNPTPEELQHSDRTNLWHSFTQMAEYEPLIFERAKGCTLTDVEGHEYLDGVSSLWCNIHGHRHPKLDAAITLQLEKVAHVTSLGCSNPTTIRLARRLVDLAPDGLQHVFFSSDGSSAVEVALKLAFQFWQQRDDPRPDKTKFVALENAYYGDTLGSVSVGGVERFHAMFEPLLFKVSRLPMPDSYRRPEGIARDAAAEYYLQQAENLLRENHGQIAALVMEPLVQGAAGMVCHPPGYLRGIRELTQKYDVLLIADEVAVGMGRTGRLFACQHEEVSPDLLCLGKGLTGGYLPLAATLATGEIWNAFLGTYDESKSFFHGHTYSGNPLSAAVAIATLDVFEEERTLEQLQPKIARLEEHLVRIAELPLVGDVRGRGLLAGIELVADRRTKEPLPWREQWGQRGCRHALSEGVWLRPLGSVVVIMPPLSVSLDELDQICNAVYNGIVAAG